MNDNPFRKDLDKIYNYFIRDKQRENSIQDIIRSLCR